MFHDTVTVRRAPLVIDPYGTQVRDWPNATSTTATGVNVQPSEQAEDAERHGSVVITGWTLHSRPGRDVDLLATDRVEWSGLTLEVAGEVARWSHPLTGAVHHVEAQLRRVTTGG